MGKLGRRFRPSTSAPRFPKPLHARTLARAQVPTRERETKRFPSAVTEGRRSRNGKRRKMGNASSTGGGCFPSRKKGAKENIEQPPAAAEDDDDQVEELSDIEEEIQSD